uniref:RING-type E3 ubiquitin transferase n=1 Tax=Trypanosoma congolense (strain IL3000) TaxID=1068625 RepID=G0UWL3_TRYCI|nr:unnamed protein product [Trypanosoma congolense IL3000]
MHQADFSCAICYDLAKEPVVTRCGHLFCWGCLSRWLNRPEIAAAPECPVCRGRVDERVSGDIIPLYGKGKGEEAPGCASKRQHQPRPACAESFASTSTRSRPAADRAPRGTTDVTRNVFSLWGGTSFFFFSPGSLGIVLTLAWAAHHFLPWRDWAQQLSAFVASTGGISSTADTSGGDTRAFASDPGSSPRRRGRQDEDQRSHERNEAVRHVGVAMVTVFGFYIVALIASTM